MLKLSHYSLNKYELYSVVKSDLVWAIFNQDFISSLTKIIYS